MERGQIDELSDQPNEVKCFEFRVHFFESNRSNPFPTQPVPTYAGVLSVPKAVTFTPNDVRRLPRLTGSADADVAEVLSQFRLVVDFRAKAVAPNDDLFLNT